MSLLSLERPRGKGREEVLYLCREGVGSGDVSKRGARIPMHNRTNITRLVIKGICERFVQNRVFPPDIRGCFAAIQGCPKLYFFLEREARKELQKCQFLQRHGTDAKEALGAHMTGVDVTDVAQRLCVADAAFVIVCDYFRKLVMEVGHSSVLFPLLQTGHSHVLPDSVATHALAKWRERRPTTQIRELGKVQASWEDLQAVLWSALEQGGKRAHGPLVLMAQPPRAIDPRAITAEQRSSLQRELGPAYARAVQARVGEDLPPLAQLLLPDQRTEGGEAVLAPAPAKRKTAGRALASRASSAATASSAAPSPAPAPAPAPAAAATPPPPRARDRKRAKPAPLPKLTSRPLVPSAPAPPPRATAAAPTPLPLASVAAAGTVLRRGIAVVEDLALEAAAAGWCVSDFALPVIDSLRAAAALLQASDVAEALAEAVGGYQDALEAGAVQNDNPASTPARQPRAASPADPLTPTRPLPPPPDTAPHAKESPFTPTHAPAVQLSPGLGSIALACPIPGTAAHRQQQQATPWSSLAGSPPHVRSAVGDAKCTPEGVKRAGAEVSAFRWQARRKTAGVDPAPAVAALLQAMTSAHQRRSEEVEAAARQLTGAGAVAARPTLVAIDDLQRTPKAPRRRKPRRIIPSCKSPPWRRQLLTPAPAPPAMARLAVPRALSPPPPLRAPTHPQSPSPLLCGDEGGDACEDVELASYMTLTTHGYVPPGEAASCNPWRVCFE